MARRRRERDVAGILTPISRCEESLCMQGMCAMHRAFPARARWGQDDRSVARPAEYIPGGAPIGTCPGMHSGVRCRATGHQSPHSSFSLGELGAGQDSGILTIPSTLRPIVSCHFFTAYYFPSHSLFLGITVIWSPLSDRISRRIEVS